MPYRCGTLVSLMRAILAATRSALHVAFELRERLRLLLAPRSNDCRLARGPEQRAVLRPQMDKSVPEPVGDGVHAHVGEHPGRRHPVCDAQRVVEAVAARALPERLTDPERNEVAD